MSGDIEALLTIKFQHKQKLMKKLNHNVYFDYSYYIFLSIWLSVQLSLYIIIFVILFLYAENNNYKNKQTHLNVKNFASIF